MNAPPGVMQSVVTRGWASAAISPTSGEWEAGQAPDTLLPELFPCQSQAAPRLVSWAEQLPTAKPGQGDGSHCPLCKAEHLAARVSGVLKVTQQTGRAGTCRRTTTRQGEDLAPCPPSLFSFTFHVELLISNSDISQASQGGSLGLSRLFLGVGSSYNWPE